MFRSSVFAIIFAVLMSAAVLAGPSGSAGVKWTLTELDGRREGDDRVQLGIDPKVNGFCGQANCNRRIRKLHLAGPIINFASTATKEIASPQLSDEVGCPAPSMVAYFRRIGDTLSLFEGRRSRMRSVIANRQNKNSPVLANTRWSLETIGEKPVGRDGSDAFLRFDTKNKSVGGNLGCNVFGGSFAAKGSRIRIYDIVSTMRACIEDDRIRIETGFSDALRKANAFRIAGDRLILSRGGRELLTLRAQP